MSSELIKAREALFYGPKGTALYAAADDMRWKYLLCGPPREWRWDVISGRFESAEVFVIDGVRRLGPWRMGRPPDGIMNDHYVEFYRRHVPEELRVI